MKTLTLITICLVFLLINLGGYVHNTGSSLACPDWPLCHGQLMPNMIGGVLIEHSHRLLASLVGFLTLIIALMTRKKSKESKMAFFALGMVILQGILGGLTVLYKLPPLISISHLALSMIFICTLIYLHHSLALEKSEKNQNFKYPLRLAVILIYMQILLGAAIRHSGRGASCGLGYTNSLLCFGHLIPESLDEYIHMSHRILAVGIGIFIAYVHFLILTQDKKRTKIFSILSFFILAMQMGLGIMTVGSGLRPIITTLHLGGAALLLSLTWKIYLLRNVSIINNKTNRNELSK